jgi:hypothetical protein
LSLHPGQAVPARADEPGARKSLLNFLLIILAIGALVSLYVGAMRAVRPGESQDFNGYAGARLLQEGKNPYAVWLNGWDNRFLWAQGPMCFPQFFYIVFPYGSMSWPAASCAWMITNVAMALLFAWLLFSAQKRPGENRFGLLIALLFLSSNPVRNVIGNGQSSLLVLLGTFVAFNWRSNPILSGAGLCLSLIKYSFGAYFVMAEFACRRVLGTIIAGAVILMAFVGVAIESRSRFNLQLLKGPLDALKAYPSFADHFLWLHTYAGDLGVKLFPVIGLAVVFWRTLVLYSAKLPSRVFDTKIFCGTVFATLLFAPHHSYDFVLLALPLALGVRLETLRPFERTIYLVTLFAYWNLIEPFNNSRSLTVMTVRTFFILSTLGLLTYKFFAKPSNLESRPEMQAAPTR